jgi:hypothetical protein
MAEMFAADAVRLAAARDDHERREREMIEAVTRSQRDGDRTEPQRKKTSVTSTNTGSRIPAL